MIANLGGWGEMRFKKKRKCQDCGCSFPVFYITSSKLSHKCETCYKNSVVARNTKISTALNNKVKNNEVNICQT